MYLFCRVYSLLSYPLLALSVKCVHPAWFYECACILCLLFPRRFVKYLLVSYAFQSVFSRVQLLLDVLSSVIDVLSDRPECQRARSTLPQKSEFSRDHINFVFNLWGSNELRIFHRMVRSKIHNYLKPS